MQRRPFLRPLCAAVFAVLACQGSALAQFPGLGGAIFNEDRTDSRGNRGALIKRRSIAGVLKSKDPEKKLFVVTLDGSKQQYDVPVDLGPVPIDAGKGRATLVDLQPGDRLKVFGEVTIQGGIRAMEVTAPPERMSIAPPEKPKKVKKERASKKVKEAPDRKEDSKEKGTGRESDPR